MNKRENIEEQLGMRTKDSALLRNRFYTMRNRAKSMGFEPQWTGFDDWMASFHRRYVGLKHPLPFRVEDWRITYNTKIGYTEEGMKIDRLRSMSINRSEELLSKARRRELELQDEIDRLKASLIFAAELTAVLTDPDNLDTLTEAVDAIQDTAYNTENWNDDDELCAVEGAPACDPGAGSANS